MIRLAIIDQDGNVVLPKDIPTAADLITITLQARHLIVNCEQLARDKGRNGQPAHAPQAPYST